MKPADIAFVGDSITAWANWPERFPDKNIGVFATPGHKTYEMRTAAQQAVASGAQKVFLLTGINDLGDNRPIDAIIDDYQMLINLLKSGSHKPLVYAISVLPVNYSMWPNTRVTLEKVEALVSEIAILCTLNSVKFLPLYSHFTDNNAMLKAEFTSDGLHLNETAYQLFGELLKTYL